MPKFTKNFLLFQSLKAENQKMNALQVLITPLLVKSTYQCLAVEFKEQLAICSVKTSVKCSMFGLKMQKRKSLSSGRLHGVSPLEVLAQ